MKKLLLISSLVLFSFNANGSVECGQLKLKIGQLYKGHSELNAMYVKNAKKPLHLWNDDDKKFLNKITRQSNEKLELAYKYSTIYNALCERYTI